MQTRHRVPVVFSIYMVDVLCCALGCVILLWQLYHHESEEANQQLAEKTSAALEANKELAKLKDLLASKSLEHYATSKELANVKSRLDDKNVETIKANKEIARLIDALALLKLDLDKNRSENLKVTDERDKLRKELDRVQDLALVRKNDLDKLKKDHQALKTECDAMKKTLAAAEATIALLQTNVKDLEKKSTLTAEELAAKIKAHAGLLDKLAEAEKKLRILTKDIALKESDYKSVAKKADDQAGLLKLLEQELTLLRAQNKEYLFRLDAFDVRVKLMEKDAGMGKKSLLDSEKRYLDLLLAHEKLNMRNLISVKELAELKSIIAGLEEDKLSLVRTNRDFKAAIENRFEGIKLTGSKVIFLVDMSGSMDLIDENTAEPDKWPLVCETVGRIMQSLSDLQQYQVILFSDGVRYAMGKEGRWLEYKGKETAKATVAALKAVKPKNETNMYDAFAEAFKFRAQGLDTIYVLSDGLPNAGEGLPPNTQNLTETQRTEILSKVVRNRLKTVWNRPIAGQDKVHINTIGFFFESPDVGAFLWALARENEGSFVGMSRP